MTRSLSAGVIAEIATNKLNPVELVYLGISTGTYYTDHYKNLSYDGNTYTASSLFLGSSEVQENADISVNSLSKEAGHVWTGYSYILFFIRSGAIFA